jgi:hypothetical protein
MIKGYLCIVKSVISGCLHTVKPVIRRHLYTVNPVIRGHLYTVNPVIRGDFCTVKPVIRRNLGLCNKTCVEGTFDNVYCISLQNTKNTITENGCFLCGHLAGIIFIYNS